MKPDFFQNDKLSALDPEAHLLAAGLIFYADDYGYFVANPKLIKAAVFPLRELSGTVPEMLLRLQEIRYIRMVAANDRDYGHIVNFLEHQRVSHPCASKLEKFFHLPETVAKIPECLVPELKGIEWNGIEGKGIPEPPSFEDLNPCEAARMYLEHEDICLPVGKFALSDVESGIKAIQRQEKLATMPALEWLLIKARRAKAAGKKVGPEWVRKADYNEVVGPKKPVPMVNVVDLKRRDMALNKGAE